MRLNLPSKIILTFFFLCLIAQVRADEFVVISFKHRPEVTAAREKVMVDVNDRKCALIIVKTDVDLSTAMFDANPMVCDSRKEAPGEWWVYVAPGSTKLQIKKEGFIPLDFFFPKDIPIESLNTYELRITNKNQTPEKDKQPEFVKIRSVPEGAKVYLDNQYKGQTPFDMPVLEGNYTWKIELDRYYTEEGEITVVTGNTPVINKTLRPRFGDINISSLPESGAEIMLDGVKLNKKTPYIIKEVNSGTHKVELLLDMYEPTSQSVTVADGQTAEMKAEMKPLFGEISIKTTPAADIYIDKVKAGNSSISNKHLVSGTHFIEAKKEKYTDATLTITIQTGSKETYTLEPQPKTGTLSVVSTPTDAGLYVDGVLKGQTPMFVRNLLIGDYSVQIKKEGYGTITKEVSIKENQTTELNETLPQGQQITINTNPAGTSIKIDGGPLQNTPCTGTLSYGNHTITVQPTAQGYLETTETISITQGGKTTFTINIKSDNQFTDNRDGKVYKTVKIGDQVWMAENLHYTANNSNQRHLSDNSTWQENTKRDGWCYYDIKSSNGSKYGVLYQWEAAKKACPGGWHLPSDDEWKTLEMFIGMSKTEANDNGWRGAEEGKKLKSKTGWNNNGNGTDAYGFSALPGSYRDGNGAFFGIGSCGYWWSGSEYYSNTTYSRVLAYDNHSIFRGSNNKEFGFSIRCIRDNSINEIKKNDTIIKNSGLKTEEIINEKHYESFTDSRDNKTYKTVKIGTQIWMAENLNYTTNSGSWCYDNNSSNCTKYGRLYDWKAAKTVCPKGWHLPSKSEFETLLNNVGGSGSNAYIALKMGGSSNFNALLGGWSVITGYFLYVENHGGWWSSSKAGVSYRWSLSMNSEDQNAYVGSSKGFGFSVRCIKD